MPVHDPFTHTPLLHARPHAGAISTDGRYVFRMGETGEVLYFSPPFFITIFIIIMLKPLGAQLKYRVCYKLIAAATDNMATYFIVIAYKIPSLFNLLRCLYINAIN